MTRCRDVALALPEGQTEPTGSVFADKFRFRNYIADFACLSKKLIVEFDGEFHNFEDQQRSDLRCDAFFTAEGFHVLRFGNHEVMSNLAGVVEAIRLAASLDAERRTPLPAPPPQGGREFRGKLLSSEKPIKDFRGPQS